MESSQPSCPCLPERSYGACCGRLHSGEIVAPTAEALMRSRYSAFVVGDIEYLRLSWHSATCPDDLALSSDQRWSGLQILDVVDGGMLDHHGEVKFVATYALPGEMAGARTLHERSRFERENNRWVYLDGVSGGSATRD